MHLLNLTVAPPCQRRGHAQTLLDALEQQCRERVLHTLWLEVRAGNHRARQVYAQRGFAEIGLRRGYYPAGVSREDALVMNKALPPARRPGDGLD
jgi:ribosomal-protein-alanine N-acetyltransferase